MARTVWYPGHMAKGKRQLEALGGTLDLILEVRDARAPRLTSSPMTDDATRSLAVWTILSKSDLAVPATTSEWLRYFKSIGRRAWAVDLCKGVPAAVKKAIQEIRPASKAGKFYREVRLAVVGTPNVGKSTLLNRLVGRRAAHVGGVPGVTKGVAWFAGDGCLVADSPGILDPRSDPRAHRMLSWISSTKGQVIGSWQEHAQECIVFLRRRQMLDRHLESWSIEGAGEAERPEEVLARIGKRLGKLLPGGVVDLEAAGKAFIDALSTGRLGALSLEKPGTPEPWLELP